MAIRALGLLGDRAAIPDRSTSFITAIRTPAVGADLLVRLTGENWQRLAGVVGGEPELGRTPFQSALLVVARRNPSNSLAWPKATAPRRFPRTPALNGKPTSDGFIPTK
jgi:hypothetical protein